MHRMTILAAVAALAVGAQSSQAGWPFFSDDGPRRGSEEWYQMRAGEPTGVRQRFHHGKVWPPHPRPAGPQQPCVHKYYAAHYWPHPYNELDQLSVRNIQQIQTANGWQLMTTLYEYHFDPLTQELNSAGREQLHWIMTHAPEGFREPHVALTPQTEANASRLASVERESALLSHDGRSVRVHQRVADPIGRPATEVHTIFQKAASSMPDPKIEYQTSGGGSGSSVVN